MFGKKPLPPHSEDLTNDQVKLLRKILKGEGHSKMQWYAKEACAQRWSELFVAAAKNEKWAYRSYKATFFEQMLALDGGSLACLVLPQITGLHDSQYGGLLAIALRKFDDETAQTLLASSIPADVRAYAVLCLTHTGGEQSKDRLLKLLEPPTNLHYSAGRLMMYALHHGHTDVAQALIAHGFDVSIYAEDIKAYLVEQKSPHAARLWLDKHSAPQAAVPAPLPAAQSLVQDGQGYLRSGDCASRVDQLVDGGSLTTIFNFATCQQITIAHVAGQTAAPVITPFSHIEGEAALLDAAAAFIKQGGAPERVYSVTMAPSTRATLIEKPARAITKATSPDSP